MYHTNTKPDFAIDPPIDIPDEYPNPTPGGPPPPESIILTCTCGAEATLFPLGSPALCYDCAFGTIPRARLSYHAVYTKYAQTLQSRAIEARLTICGRCQGIHHVQTCPDLLARLFAGAA